MSFRSGETPWVQKYIDDGWQWRKKQAGTPHLMRGERTLCGRSAAGMDQSPDMRIWLGCLSCRDIAGGIIFDRRGGFVR